MGNQQNNLQRNKQQQEAEYDLTYFEFLGGIVRQEVALRNDGNSDIVVRKSLARKRSSLASLPIKNAAKFISRRLSLKETQREFFFRG